MLSLKELHSLNTKANLVAKTEIHKRLLVLLRHWSLVVKGELCSFGLFISIMSTEQAMDECSNEEELLRNEMESTNTAENTTTTNSGDSLVAMIADHESSEHLFPYLKPPLDTF